MAAWFVCVATLCLLDVNRIGAVHIISTASGFVTIVDGAASIAEVPTEGPSLFVPSSGHAGPEVLTGGASLLCSALPFGCPALFGSAMVMLGALSRFQKATLTGYSLVRRPWPLLRRPTLVL